VQFSGKLDGREKNSDFKGGVVMVIAGPKSGRGGDLRRRDD